MKDDASLTMNYTYENYCYPPDMSMVKKDTKIEPSDTSGNFVSQECIR